MIVTSSIRQAGRTNWKRHRRACQPHAHTSVRHWLSQIHPWLARVAVVTAWFCLLELHSRNHGDFHHIVSQGEATWYV